MQSYGGFRSTSHFDGGPDCMVQLFLVGISCLPSCHLEACRHCARISDRQDLLRVKCLLLLSAIIVRDYICRIFVCRVQIFSVSWSEVVSIPTAASDTIRAHSQTNKASNVANRAILSAIIASSVNFVKPQRRRLITISQGCPSDDGSSLWFHRLKRSCGCTMVQKT